MKILYVFDIDGVLVDNSSFKELGPEIYFSDSHIVNLPPKEKLVEIANQCYGTKNTNVLFLTGRKQNIRQGTEAWLRENTICNISQDTVIMRPDEMSWKNVPEFKAKEIYKFSKIFSEIIVYEDTEECLTTIGALNIHSKLYLVEGDTIKKYKGWEHGIEHLRHNLIFHF